MKTTLQDVLDARIPVAIGSCGVSNGVIDPRFLGILNEADRRLLFEGKYWGTFGKYQICCTNGCVTLPRQIATIEMAAVCHQPIPVHDQWFQFLDNGPGTDSKCSSWNKCEYKGRFCVFSDIVPLGKKLNLICDVAQDVGVQVLCLGYDDNGNWIRTNQGGTIMDGELIALAQGSGTLSVNNFSCITDIQLPVRSGQVWLYEWTISTATPRMIGQYASDETRPSYARYYLPWIQCVTNKNNVNPPPSPLWTVMLEIMAKKEFVPVRVLTDYTNIGNPDALKVMAVAISNAEDEENALVKNQIIESGMALAKDILDKELTHYEGDGRYSGIQLTGSSIGFVEPIENFV